MSCYTVSAILLLASSGLLGCAYRSTLRVQPIVEVEPSGDVGFKLSVGFGMGSMEDSRRDEPSTGFMWNSSFAGGSTGPEGWFGPQIGLEYAVYSTKWRGLGLHAGALFGLRLASEENSALGVGLDLAAPWYIPRKAGEGAFAVGPAVEATLLFSDADEAPDPNWRAGAGLTIQYTWLNPYRGCPLLIFCH